MLKKFGLLFILLGSVIACTAADKAQLQEPFALQFPNPGFEEDAGGAGLPDHWILPAKFQGKLVTDHVSEGNKALRITDGYNTVSCEFRVKKLAGMNVSFSLDAAGEDGAAIGVMFGYFIEQNGKKRWVTSQPVWNTPLTKKYQTIKRSFKINPNAIDGRLWFCVYRSNRKGVLYLDNFKLHAITPGSDFSAADIRRQVELLREIDYAASKAKSLPPSHARQFSAEIKRIRQQAAVPERKSLDAAEQKWSTGEISARINYIANKKKDLRIMWAKPFERLDPARLPAASDAAGTAAFLNNEYAAMSIIAANGKAEPVKLELQVNGFEKFSENLVVRRQLPLVNYYQRGAITIADPLIKLVSPKTGYYTLPMAAGETVKLELIFKVKASAQDFPVALTVNGQRLAGNVKVLPAMLPDVEFENLQCIYPEIGVVGKNPHLAAKDLKEHYTTIIEFPYLPTVEFSADGKLLTPERLPRSQQAKWMRAYGSEKINMAIFWAGGYSKMRIAGAGNKFLPFTKSSGSGLALTPEWKKAFKEILDAFMAMAAKENFAQYMQIWCDDESGSKEDWANAPSAKMHIVKDIYRYSKELQPNLERILTHGMYTLKADAEFLVSEVDNYVVHWPLPEHRARWSKKNDNARKEFFAEVLPMLKAERARRGMKLTSYHVEAGKTEEVLFERAYPLAAVGMGFTGIGTWAYNIFDKSSWDDTDGKILDYSFIYDGTEQHPLNLKYNLTREKIVPSIRWEALRYGIQSARILLALKQMAEKGTLKSEITSEVKSILDRCNGFGEKMDYSEPEVTQIEKRIRELYVTATKK